MASEDPFVDSGGVLKSVSDDREYRHITLPNKLDVVLVSDATTEMAATSMCVGVGHFSDPEELPGLAHFLEHMLFLGTEKYPDENSYAEFVSAHGGHSNAFTGTEYTNYHVSVQAGHLREALDRFSQFFIAPLFTESATGRELLAVDSEHAKNVQNDTWRLYQLDKSTSAPDHPYHKFGTGSAATLSDAPKAKGIDVRAALLDFHATWYSANLMSLVVVGKEPLDTLEAWVTELFSGVANRDTPAPVIPGAPYGPEQLGVQQTVAPVQDTHTITIGWPLPEQQSKYKTKPASLLSHLFGHEGAGSILSVLKAKGWALECMAGVFTSESSFALFGVELEVPPAALDHVDDIVGIVYGYVRMLAAAGGGGGGSQAWVYQEVVDIANATFRFANKVGPLRHALVLAGALRKYPAAHCMTGPRLYWEHAPAEAAALLELMTPANMRLRVASQTLAAVCTDAEPWYGTPYRQERIEAARMEAWMTAPIDPALRLPDANPFIATDFGLRVAKAPAPEDPDLGALPLRDAATAATLRAVATRRTVVPDVIRNDDAALLFFAPDTLFAKPKLRCYLQLVSPAAYDSPRSAVLSDLYSQLVKEELNELSYHATVANLAYSFQLSNKGFSLELSGFNHKVHVLAERVAAVLPAPGFTDDVFERFRAKTERDYRNQSVTQQPYTHAMLAANCALNTPRFLTRDKLAPIADVTADELRAFVPRLVGQVYVLGAVHGNATAAEANAVVDALVAPMRAKPLPVVLRHATRVSALPYGVDHRVWQPALNPEDPNAGVEVSFQVGPQGTHQNVLVDLLAHMIREPFFDSLRTKQSLGYMVWAGVRLDTDVNAIRFIFQSDKVGADELDRRIEAFVTHYRSKLVDMPADQFDTNVRAVLLDKLAAHKKPSDVHSHLRSEIQCGCLDFNRTVKETQALLAVTKERLVEFYNDFLMPDGKHRRKLASLVEAGKVPGAVAAAKEEAKDGGDDGGAASKGGGDGDDGGEAAPAIDWSDPALRAGPAGTLLSQDAGAAVVAQYGAVPCTLSSEQVGSAVTSAGIALPDGASDRPVVDVTDLDAFKLSLGHYPNMFATRVATLSRL